MVHRLSSVHWCEGDGGKRLDHDQSLVALAYPGLRFRVNEDRVTLDGLLPLEAECGIITKVQIRIDFLDNYPEREPLAYDASNRFPHIADRHFYTDGRCCLWHPLKSMWQSEEPKGLIAFLDQVSVFFDRQLIYDVTKTWPGPQYSHGFQGYQEVIVELLGGEPHLVNTFARALTGVSGIGRNSLCPCGSGVKYKKCHRDPVETIKSRSSHDPIASEILSAWRTTLIKAAK